MPFYSPWTPVDAIPDQNLWEFEFQNKSHRHADDRVLFVDAATKRELTYGERFTDSRRLGFGLATQPWAAENDDAGLKTILLLGRPHIDLATIAAGAHYAGFVVTTADPNHKAADLAYQLKDSSSCVMVVDPVFLELAKAGAALAGLDETRIFVLGDTAAGNVSPWKSLCREPASSSEEWPPSKAVDTATHPAYIVYTSGSTGNPKGVLISHKGLITQALNTYVTTAPFSTDDECTLGLPTWAVGGLVTRQISLHFGWKIVITQDFSFPTTLGLMQDYKMSWGVVTPLGLAALALSDMPLKYDLSSVKWLGILGATWPAEHAIAIWKRFKIKIRNHYGMTETCGHCATQSVLDALSTVGSTGHLSPGVEGMLLDEEGQEVGEAVEGRLFIKSPCRMLGYLNKPEATAQVFTKDGFYETGDLASLRDGLLTIHGRVADQVSYRGSKFMAAELEAHIKSHESVNDCAVLVLPGKDGPRADPRVLITTSAESTVEAITAELIGFIGTTCPPAMFPRGGISIVASIPRSPVTGKVKKQDLLAIDAKH